MLKTDVDDYNGVYLGFMRDAPSLCVWDAAQWNAPVTGAMSLVFRCDDLDATIVELQKKGLVLGAPEKFDWGTYELRLKDPDDNEVVIVEYRNE